MFFSITFLNQYLSIIDASYILVYGQGKERATQEAAVKQDAVKSKGQITWGILGKYSIINAKDYNAITPQSR